MTPADVLAAIDRKLIVSCQAPPGSPLRDPGIIARLALCAELGGAAALRIDSATNIRAVRTVSRLPIVGLVKRSGPRRPLITTTLEDAVAIVTAGAEIVAIEVSPDSPAAADLIGTVRTSFPALVMADVATIGAARVAAAAGADLVATTLSGYLGSSPPPEGPDLDLVRAIAGLGVPVVAEGRYRTREDVAAAFAAGAHSVVVGSAITDPISTTRWFADTGIGR